MNHTLYKVIQRNDNIILKSLSACDSGNLIPEHFAIMNLL